MCQERPGNYVIFTPCLSSIENGFALAQGIEDLGLFLMDILNAA